jgi:hypothetical protein
MGLNVTPEEKEEYRRLNNLRMKLWRDKKRVRKFSPRKKEDEKQCGS